MTIKGAIAGVSGDGSAASLLRQVDFIPQKETGYRAAVTAASAELGPLTVGKTYHITVSVNAWVLVGPTGESATVGDGSAAGSCHCVANGVYEYVPKSGADYVQFIKDTDSDDGYIAISRVEA